MFLLGVAGLAVDIGRMFITKDEAQAFVDSASLRGDANGRHWAGFYTRHQCRVYQSGAWQFSDTAFSNITTTFATSSAGPFTASPTGSTYTYVRVATTVNLPMPLLRPLVGSTAQVSASALATKLATNKNK